MCELDHKGWDPKNWCFQNVVLEKTLESPLNSKEIKLVNSKENLPGLLTWRADAEAEAPILWPPDVKSWLIGKDLDAGKDWRQEKRAIGVRWMNGIADAMDMNMGKLWEMVRDREAWRAAIHVVAKSWTQVGNWTII